MQPCATMCNHVQPCATMRNHVQPCATCGSHGGRWAAAVSSSGGFIIGPLDARPLRNRHLPTLQGRRAQLKTGFVATVSVCLPNSVGCGMPVQLAAHILYNRKANLPAQLRFVWVCLAYRYRAARHSHFQRYAATTCAGACGHGPNTSYRGPFIRSCRPTMWAAIFMIAASGANEPRHRGSTRRA